MKSNAITRIVIYSLVILLLVALLLVGMGIGQFTFRIHSSTGTVVESGSVSAAGIHTLDIDWASGNIVIESGEVSEISFRQLGSSDSQPVLTYRENGGTLELCCDMPAISIGFVSTPKADLVITVPGDWKCRSLNMDSASVHVRVADLTVDTVDLDGASGSYRFENCTIGTLDMDGASNTLYVQGLVNRMYCDGMSINITLSLPVAPRELTIDGMSGRLELTLPAGSSGFRVEMEGMSSRFSSDFETVSPSRNTYVYGDGLCQISVSGMSNSVSIRKADESTSYPTLPVS